MSRGRSRSRIAVVFLRLGISFPYGFNSHCAARSLLGAEYFESRSGDFMSEADLSGIYFLEGQIRIRKQARFYSRWSDPGPQL